MSYKPKAMDVLKGLRYTKIYGSDVALNSQQDQDESPESMEDDTVDSTIVDESFTDPEADISMVPSIYDKNLLVNEESVEAKSAKSASGSGGILSMLTSRPPAAKKSSLTALLDGNRSRKQTPNSIADVEKKIFDPSKKSVNVKDFLSGKPAAASGRVEGPPSYFVKLKVDKEALAFYKKFENPLKSRGTSTYNPKKYPVTLKIGKDKLKQIQPAKKSNANAVFAMMMKEAASETTKLTPLQKLKKLDPPTVSYRDFHILPEDSCIPRTNRFAYELKPRQRPSVGLLDPSSHSMEFLPRIQSTSPQFYSTTYMTLTEEARRAFYSRCTGEYFTHLYKELFSLQTQVSWPQLFEPEATEALLLSSANRTQLKEWVENSFEMLIAESFKGQRKLKRKPNKSALNGFIVADDDIEESSDFMPLLIIQGDTGTGKSSAVYTAMKDMNGYVHEINAGQQRSRRDLLSVLKELCTTQLIHQQQGDEGFQKGLVLLEDCDILFEQDRTFWTVVTEILEISRRPIVITCTDPSVIPKQVYERALEDSAVLDFNKNRPRDRQMFKDYIWGCCFTQGFDLDDDVLDYILNDSTDYHKKAGFDIRHSLVTCQMICRAQVRPVFYEETAEIVEIKKRDGPTKAQGSLTDLTQQLDLLSVTDIIDTNSSSQVKHSEIDNEFIDVYYIDESKQMKQPLMPHEQTITSSLYDMSTTLAFDISLPQPQTINTVRTYINDYVSSRSKPMPSILQGLGPRTTRTNQTIQTYEFWRPDMVGIPDGSICTYLSPTPFILDFSPYVRYWCMFQNGLDKLDKDTEIRTKTVIGWREFQMKGASPLRTSLYNL